MGYPASNADSVIQNYRDYALDAVEMFGGSAFPIKWVLG
jgi:hypothetical protein